MVTFSRGGGQFIAGKAADDTDDAACIAGTVAGAQGLTQLMDVPHPSNSPVEVRVLAAARCCSGPQSGLKMYCDHWFWTPTPRPPEHFA